LALEYVSVAGNIGERHPAMQPLLNAADTERPRAHG
jgi:hypothetical protein